jgi:hypothetical protein
MNVGVCDTLPVILTASWASLSVALLASPTKKYRFRSQIHEQRHLGLLETR